MERLGKNKGSYAGETIDIKRLSNELHQTATDAGWLSETFLETAEFTLRAYRHQNPSPRKRLYLSAGIHGDEPAGPLALLEALKENRWPQDVDIWLCPCLNPAGFPRNTRENARGIDLNRDYRHLVSEEVRAHARWLDQQPNFDLSVILHEDWEANGFYVYEVNHENGPSYAQAMLNAVAPVCPIEMAPVVDNWTADRGVIRIATKPEDRPQWAEALYLIVHKTRQSYTLETPSDFALPVRVAAHLAALRAVLDAL